MLGTIVFFLIYNLSNIFGIIGIYLSLWIIISSIFTLIKNKNIKNSIGMGISHLGVGLLILGITGSSIWQQEKIVRMNVNQSIKVNNYDILFKEIIEIKGQNYVAIQGGFIIHDKKKNIVANLTPQNRFYPVTNSFTSEASIHTNIFRDLYIVLGQGNSKDGWIIRLYYNPLVAWIWIGAITIFIGGIVSTYKNIKKVNI